MAVISFILINNYTPDYILVSLSAVNDGAISIKEVIVMHEYPCQLIKVINGNTIEADIDLGFNIKIKQRIRLYGVEDSEEAKTALIKTLPKEFICKTIYNKRGKVGRVLGYLFVEDNDGNLLNINEQLAGQGFSKQL